MSLHKGKFFGGLISQYLYQIILTLLQVLIAPLLLRKSGDEALGGYAAIMQFTGYLTLLDLGFASTLSRYLTQAYAKDNSKSFSNLFAIGRWYLFIVSLVIALLILICSFSVPSVIGLTKNLLEEGQRAMLILAVWYGCRFYFFMFTIALYSSQNMMLVNVCQTIGILIRLGLTLLFVYLDYGIIGVVLANIIGDLITAVLHMIIFLHQNKHIKLTWKIGDKSIFKELYSFGLNTFLINISSRIMTSSSVLLTSILLGPVIASHYYSMSTPIFVFNTLILVITYNIVPGLNGMFARGEMDALQRTYTKTMKIILSILFTAFWGLIIYHKFIVVLWVGPEQYEGFTYTFLMSIYLFFLTISSFNENVLIVLGDIKWFSKLQLGTTVAGLAISVIGGYYLGLKGIILGNLLSIIPLVFYVCYRIFKLFGIRFSIFSILPDIGYLLLLSAVSLTILTLRSVGLIHIDFYSLVITGATFGILWFFRVPLQEERLSIYRAVRKTYNKVFLMNKPVS